MCQKIEIEKYAEYYEHKHICAVCHLSGGVRHGSKSMSNSTKIIRKVSRRSPVRVFCDITAVDSGLDLSPSLSPVSGMWSPFSQNWCLICRWWTWPVMDPIFVGVWQGVALRYAIKTGFGTIDASLWEVLPSSSFKLFWAQLHPWAWCRKMRHNSFRNRLGCPVHTSFSSILKTLRTCLTEAPVTEKYVHIFIINRTVCT